MTEITTEDTLFQKIKKGLSVTNDSADDVLIQKLNTVKGYMIGAGVSTSMLNTDLGIGTIVVGVTDLWNNKAGEIKFSPAFNLLLGQLAARSVWKDEI